MTTPAKEPYIVKTLQFNGSSTSHVEITQTFESKEAAEAAMAKRAKEKDAERKSAETKFHGQVEQTLTSNAGSDVIPIPQAALKDKWKNPGKKEVLASMRSLTPQWTTADLSKINTYVATGKAPSTVDIKALAKTWAAETATASSRTEKMIYGMLGNQGVNNPALAVYWLAQALPKVFMHPKIIENAIRQAQPGFGTTREVAWLKAMMYYNGACKNLWEAKTFGDPKQASALSGAEAEEEDESEEESEEATSSKRKADASPEDADEPATKKAKKDIT